MGCLQVTEKQPMLVTFEGIEASGKSTIVSQLQHEYDSEELVFTCEPNPKYKSESIIRDKLTQEEVNPETLYYLFTANHIVHIQDVIRPALQSNKTVISDRYYDSAFAYQSAEFIDKGYQFNQDTIEKLKSIQSIGEYQVKPDITILLDVSPEVALERISDRDYTERFDKKKYLQRVQENYNKLASRDENRFIRVDAEQELPVVYEKCVEILKSNGALQPKP